MGIFNGCLMGIWWDVISWLMSINSIVMNHGMNHYESLWITMNHYFFPSNIMDYSLVIKHGLLEIHPFGSLCFPITKTSVEREDFPANHDRRWPAWFYRSSNRDQNRTPQSWDPIPPAFHLQSTSTIHYLQLEDLNVMESQEPSKNSSFIKDGI